VSSLDKRIEQRPHGRRLLCESIAQDDCGLDAHGVFFGRDRGLRRLQLEVVAIAAL
jgi:hypothetical protein